MTEPELIDVDVPAEQVRVGDVLLIDTVEHHVERVILDAVPEFVYAFVPEQVPIPRDHLVRVRRRPTVAPDPVTVDPVEHAAIRDLVLQIADAYTGKPTPAQIAAISGQATKVRKVRKP